MKKMNKHGVQAKISLLLLIALFSKLDGFAQNGKEELKKKTTEKNKPKPNLKPLKIGDHLPDIEFSKLINYRNKTVKLSKFKGKWIILDFWATTCAPCIKNFPKMDSLQQKFSGKLQVILVNTKKTKDTKDRIIAAFKRLETVNGFKINLPIIFEDTILEKLFPYQLVPHYVWIDEKGILRHITESEFVTAVNIQAELAGKKLELPEKRDFLEFDFDAPLFVNGNGGKGEDIRFRSLLTGHTEGLPGSLGIMCKNDSCWKMFGTNISILSLYKHAYPQIANFAKNRIILDVRNPSKYDYGYSANWKYENTYCYELIVPKTSNQSIHRMMQVDLKRFFDLDINIQKQKVLCLILRKIAEINNVISKGGNPGNNLEEESKFGKYISNLPIAVLVTRLNNLLSTPVLDETNFSGKVDIKLPNDLTDVKTLNESLKQYGFELTEEEREIEMVIIRDLFSTF